MKKLMYSVLIAGLALACISPGSAADPKKDPPPLQGLDKKFDIAPEKGFQALWNAKGPFGKPENNEPLPFLANKKFYSLPAENGKDPRPNSIKICNGGGNLGQFESLDPQKVTRYAIHQYTMQEDAKENVWLFNGNFILMGDFEGTGVVKIFLNGKEVKSYDVKGYPRVATLFEENFGKLKKDDVIQLVFAPTNEKASNCNFKLIYGIKTLPDGKSPEKIINHVMPEADQPIPPMMLNGDVRGSYRWTMWEHNRDLKKFEPGLILLGDSLTSLWRWGNNPCYSQSGTLEGGYNVGWDKLKKYNPVGLGISGDWTNNLIWRLDNYNFSKENPPKIATVMIGTNNIGNGYTYDQVVKAQKVIVQKLREKLPTTKILLIAIPPRSGNTIDNPMFAEIQKVNAETAKMADNKNVFYMDLCDVLAPGGKIDSKVFYDRLHLTHYGLNLWADAMIPVLDKILEAK